MISALSGFALIGVIVLVGWATRRWGGLPENAEAVLGRLVYSVMTPCLLFSGVAAADLGVLLSEPLVVSTAAALGCFGLHVLVVRRGDRGTRIVGALAAGYTNANYIGIPVATYVLGDAALVVPIVMLQLLIVTPVALTLLEFATAGHASWRSTVTAPVRNPLIVAVVLADRVATITAVVLKTAGMPAFAFLLAVALGLARDATYAVTVLAGLPTAQNIFLYAQRFQTGLALARDAIFLSTVVCVPALLLIAILFTL